MNKKISIVIPFYNEQSRLENSLKILESFFNDEGFDYEIIGIDDGSSDTSKTILQKFIMNNNKIKLFSNKTNCGKGFSIKKGVVNSKQDILLFTDCDLSTPIEEMKKMLFFIKKYDVVIGSRWKKGADVKMPVSRIITSKIFSLFPKIILGLKYKDTQCGFKMFKTKVAKKLFSISKIKRFTFDAEILYLGKKFGFKIKEVPVKWVFTKGSKVKIFKDSIAMLIDLIRIKLNYIKGKYKT